MADFEATVAGLRGPSLSLADRAELDAATALVAKAAATRALGVGQFTADFATLSYNPGPTTADMFDGTAPRLRNHFLTGKRQGMLCEAAATQLVYGNSFVGANAGTGALPTQWGTAFSVGGLTATTVALSGDYIDVRIQGTPAATGTFCIHFLGSSAGLAVSDYVTGSFDAKRVSAAATGVVGEFIAIYENAAAFASIAASSRKAITINDDAFFGYAHTRQLTAAASNVTHLFVIDVTSGVAVDVTYRIRKIQRVEGQAVTSFIANAGTAPVTRAADAVVIKPAIAETLFADPNWTFDVAFAPDRQATGSIFYEVDNLGNGVFAYVIDGIATVTVYRVGSAQVDITAGPALPLLQNVIRVTSTSTSVAVSINGSPFTSSAVAALASPGTSWTCAVGYHPDELPLGGSIDRLSVFAGIALASTPTPANVAYDHFRRVDGPLGDAAYGRYIEVIGRDTIGTPDASLTRMQIVTQRARSGAGVTGGAVDYAAFDVGAPITGFMTRVIYDPGSFTYNQVGAQIGSPWGGHYVSQVVSGSLHIVNRYTAIDVAYFRLVPFEGTQDYEIQQSISITTTPNVEYPMGWLLDGIGGIVIVLPDQSMERVKFPAGMTANGSFGIFEHFRGDVSGTDANTRPLRYIGVMVDGRR